MRWGLLIANGIFAGAATKGARLGPRGGRSGFSTRERYGTTTDATADVNPGLDVFSNTPQFSHPDLKMTFRDGASGLPR
jgi:hypothetical protein